MFRPGGAALLALLLIAVVTAPDVRSAQREKPKDPHVPFGAHFQTSDRCLACHNGLTTSSGEDISIGFNWRTSMMANSARDPYWQAGVRRETIDHPDRESRDRGRVLHLPHAGRAVRGEAGWSRGRSVCPSALRMDKPGDRLAADGVTCSVCHQITPDNFGKRESFIGGFMIDPTRKSGERPAYGPFKIDTAQTSVMRSSATFTPTEAEHIRDSELCATCHTLLYPGA